MATNAKQDKDFIEAVIGTGILEESVDWIAKNMDVDQVFFQKSIV
jgi:hypothetical protein